VNTIDPAILDDLIPFDLELHLSPDPELVRLFKRRILALGGRYTLTRVGSAGETGAAQRRVVIFDDALGAGSVCDELVDELIHRYPLPAVSATHVVVRVLCSDFERDVTTFYVDRAARSPSRLIAETWVRQVQRAREANPKLREVCITHAEQAAAHRAQQQREQERVSFVTAEVDAVQRMIAAALAEDPDVLTAALADVEVDTGALYRALERAGAGDLVDWPDAAGVDEPRLADPSMYLPLPHDTHTPHEVTLLRHGVTPYSQLAAEFGQPAMPAAQWLEHMEDPAYPAGVTPPSAPAPTEETFDMTASPACADWLRAHDIDPTRATKAQCTDAFNAVSGQVVARDSHDDAAEHERVQAQHDVLAGDRDYVPDPAFAVVSTDPLDDLPSDDPLPE